MDKITRDNKATIWTAIIVAVLTFAIASFTNSWSKIDDTLTQEQVTEQIERNGEEILERSRRYTDDKVNAMTGTYEVHIENIEKLLQASDEKFETILHSIDNRLNRIDKRIDNK